MSYRGFIPLVFIELLSPQEEVYNNDDLKCMYQRPATYFAVSLPTKQI